MGGGKTRRKETAARGLTRLLKSIAGAAGDGASGAQGHGDILGTRPCERDQLVSFRGESPSKEGLAVRVAIGEPPTIVAGGATIGTISDRRQGAVLVACLEDGYRVGGTIVSFDPQTGEGLATVVGVKV
ncbi:MAG: hypothetical protein QOH16_1471 [Gaiellaceae bacterium]|nr:hypothetical protein [Gaiellaceae bacterium]